jgi:hypothetical protein
MIHKPTPSDDRDDGPVSSNALISNTSHAAFMTPWVTDSVFPPTRVSPLKILVTRNADEPNLAGSVYSGQSRPRLTIETMDRFRVTL